MEEDHLIDRKKVKDEFDRRALLHGNMNAVLDAGKKPGIARQNVLRDYLTRKQLIRNLKPGVDEVILDFGCGIGRLTSWIKPSVRQIIGVDVSEPMIETARKLDKGAEPAQYVLMHDKTLPFQSNMLDKIFTVWVLQHIDDEELSALAREFIRVLKPGGQLVILEQTREKRTLLCDIHIHRAVDNYTGIFEKAGFITRENRAAMRVPSYAMSLWNRFSFLPASFLPLLGFIEKQTLHYKPKYVEYYTWSFIFQKQ